MSRQREARGSFDGAGEGEVGERGAAEVCSNWVEEDLISGSHSSDLRFVNFEGRRGREKGG